MGTNRAIQVIGLTFCTFLSRRFALPSPDSTVNSLFYALVTCDSRRIGYIDNGMKTTSPTPDAILQTAFGFWNFKVLLTASNFYVASSATHRFAVSCFPDCSSLRPLRSVDHNHRMFSVDTDSRAHIWHCNIWNRQFQIAN